MKRAHTRPRLRAPAPLPALYLPTTHRVQFVTLPRGILERRELSAGAKLLYALLVRYIGRRSHAWPRLAQLATDLGVSRRTARRYRAELERYGLVQLEHRGFHRSSRVWLLFHAWLGSVVEKTARGATFDRPSPVEGSRLTPHAAAPSKGRARAGVSKNITTTRSRTPAPGAGRGREAAATVRSHSDGNGNTPVSELVAGLAAHLARDPAERRAEAPGGPAFYKRGDRNGEGVDPRKGEKRRQARR